VQEPPHRIEWLVGSGATERRGELGLRGRRAGVDEPLARRLTRLGYVTVNADYGIGARGLRVLHDGGGSGAPADGGQAVGPLTGDPLLTAAGSVAGVAGGAPGNCRRP